MNIGRWIERHGVFTPGKTALRFEGQTLSYAELAAEIEQAAWTLEQELGVVKGDRVAILATNVPEYLILLFACARLGVMLNPLNWRLAIPEHLYILGNAEAKVLIVEKAFGDLVGPLREGLPGCQMVGLDYEPAGGGRWSELNSRSCGKAADCGQLNDPLLLVYTSGTTGLPKGAVLTQDALLHNAYNSIHMQDLTAQDHVLTPLPLFHVGGLNNQTTPILYCGGTVTLQRRFHPTETLMAIQSERPTATCLVPATLQACLADPLWEETDFSSLRILVTGSTTVPNHLAEGWRAKGIIVVEMYGATETGPVSIYHRPDSDFSKLGSTGLPGLHSEIRVMDLAGNDLGPGEPGEIWVKGAHILQGYWRDEAASAAALQDGWFATGDVGFRDKDGYYYIKDRKKNLIISGGENVYPAEIERILAAHPAIQDIAVIGMPDERWGEVPVGVVVLKPGEVVSEAVLVEYLQGQLAGFKIPRRYIFVDSLPKNALGKIQHYQIRAEMRG